MKSCVASNTKQYYQYYEVDLASFKGWLFSLYTGNNNNKSEDGR